jgi:hypothetical protein
MADFIVLRLVPETSVDAATFANYLNLLTIDVFDISFANPKAGTPGDPTLPIGSATYNAPAFGPFPSPFPPPPPFVNYPAGTTIVQHFTPQVVLGVIIGVTMGSVATAVIPYIAPALEYPGGSPAPDLRIRLQRGGKTIVDPSLYYNVILYSDAAAPTPTPENYQALPAAGVSVYVTLPAALDPSLSHVELPTDGNPPSYDGLLAAVNNVLAADPGGGGLAALVAATGPLTVPQCKNIAHEIIWGSKPGLPPPPADLEDMYTNPPNTGTLSDPNEQERSRFDGELESFYAARDAQAELLTKFVFALSAAIWCEQQSTAATEAIIRFPVNPGAATGLATVTGAEVIITGALGLDIPAQYFYALGAQLPPQVTPEQRFRMACSAEQQQNLAQLKAAFEAGVIVVPPTAPQPAVNPAQAARMLSALAVRPISSATRCAVASIAQLWADWLAYPPVAAWQAYEPGDDFSGFWPNEVTQPAPIPAQFLQLVLCALTQGYVHPDDGQLLANKIQAGLPVAQVTDLTALTAAQWTTFFTATNPLPAWWPNANIERRLPPFTRPGNPDERIAAFIRHVQKFFQLSVGAPGIPLPVVNAAPTLHLPTLFDPIQSFVVAYDALIGGGFVFGTPFVPVHVQTAIAAVFPGDVPAQHWLEEKVRALNDLCQLAAVPGNVNPLAPNLPFSIAEALYARGFTSIGHVQALSFADFEMPCAGRSPSTMQPPSMPPQVR